MLPVRVKNVVQVIIRLENVQLSRKFLCRNQEVGGSCKYLQTNDSVSLPVRRSQHSVASYRQFQSSGVVANIKEKWEHRHDGGQLEESVRKRSQSPPKVKILHKPIGKSNSSSPPAKRPQKNKLISSVSDSDDLNAVKSTPYSRKTLLENGRGNIPPSSGRFSQRIKPSLPASKFDLRKLNVADNSSIIAQVVDNFTFCQYIDMHYTFPS